MRKSIKAAALLVLGVVLPASSYGAYQYFVPTSVSEPAADPMLKILVSGGHGSGFHIGGGLVLTAAHVVGTATQVEVQTNTGAKDKADVLWVNKDRDVALIKLAKLRPKADKAACRTPSKGEDVEARGNPLNIDFVSTWGKVAGDARKVGPWQNAIPVNMAIIPGQSGGPLYDAHGVVVGMNVGVMVVPLGFSGSFAGIGYVVPGATLCELLPKV